ncbi:hypothetical protein MON38_14140 [Hymenobacter sp. DH14]|uniref:DUF4136 domain-containing protein n=1 Tax=Hymenobacter cyanobacteriorum TaxID=2926463 RepID=A0A9X1VGM4_9BACT|nr:hypothetical protein [Hymenobacter cyanobacteriorum]MCI1188566.1 hypothetical protein [Hymenobacter cyanobacteriorum]
MKTFCTVLAVAAGIFALGQPARSQTTSPAADSMLVAVAVVSAQQQYTASFTDQPQLYNGPEYADYSRRYNARIGHQFFLAPDRQPGSVDYNGHYFPNIQLAYDVVRDQVVVPVADSPLTLRLVDEHVRAFDIGSHHFVRVVADSSTGPDVRTGYYEVMVDSCVQVVAKRSKRLHEQLKDRVTDVEFVVTDRYFIRKAGVYYPVTSKATAVRVFADHSREVQQFIREQALSFGKEQLDASLVRLARYYCHLPQR